MADVNLSYNHTTVIFDDIIHNLYTLAYCLYITVYAELRVVQPYWNWFGHRQVTL